MINFKPKIFLETERLIMRELLPEDAEDLFALDSDPEVHKYLGNKPVQSIEECRNIIDYVRKQYSDNGIGRWATVEKSSGNFIGWAGLKYFREEVNQHVNFYDVGYRLMKKYWGKGYATEAAIAAVVYGFNTLKANEIYAMIDSGNGASRRVLEKAGFKHAEPFLFEGDPSDWFKITKADFTKMIAK